MAARASDASGVSGRREAPFRRRRARLRVANGVLEWLWRSRLASRPHLAEVPIIEEAVRRTGLEDFGDPWFRRPFRQLLDSLEGEARLNAVGRTVARIHCVKLLRERLWAQQWFSRHPEVRERPLAAPIVVVGAMRSGTTRLHRLLAADARFVHLRLYETICPVPDPALANGHGAGWISQIDGQDPRPRIAARYLGLLHRANPDTAFIHPTGPREPEEELGLLVASAWGMKHEAQWRIPGYARWCESEDAAPAYAHLADLLRLTGWLRGDDPAKPWLLKTPQHMLDLPALLRVFPDARLIFIHRDPAKVVGSSCSMVWNQMRVQSDATDPEWIGGEWIRKTRLKIDRMRATRAGLPPSQAIDVQYDQMDRDWRGAMQRIYAFLGLDMDPAEAAMTAYVERAERQHAYRSHSYDLKAFGLEAGAVRERFADYIADFDIPASGEGAD